MFAYMIGKVVDVEEDNVVMEVNQIGYNIKISAKTVSCLPVGQKEIKLYTYTCVREDAFLLYGFINQEELKLFKKLITVNGIGPKGALAILSVLSSRELLLAILSGDVKTISKAPGVGVKTAQRLILDLKDKVSMDTLTMESFSEELLQTGIESGEDQNMQNKARREAVEALAALGYSTTEAYQAVSKVLPSEDMETEAILKMALKYLI